MQDFSIELFDLWRINLIKTFRIHGDETDGSFEL